MDVKNFLVTTRPEEKNRKISGGRCFDIKNVPLTRIVHNQDPVMLKSDIENYRPNIIVITSSIGADIFLNAHISGNFTIICIGRKTAEPFNALKRKVLIPGEENSGGIVRLISNYTKDTRIALCRSRTHNAELDEYLSSNAYNFKCFDLYDIEEMRSPSIVRELMDPNCKGLILTSSMEARIFAKLTRDIRESPAFRVKKIFCIGRPTRETAESLGLRCEALNAESDVDAMVEEISKIHCNSGEWI